MIATARAVLWGGLARHPAFEAWSCSSDRPSEPPEHIEVLHQNATGATYRLVGLGGEDGSMLARRSTAQGAFVARAVHERILPALPVARPRYRGFQTEGREFGWIFLDARDHERYSAVDPEHRALAGHWTGKLHAAATGMADAAALPDAGPARYAAELRAARHAIRANSGNPLFTSQDASMLERLDAALRGLDLAWCDLERACAGVPPTLSHGDYRLRHALVGRRFFGDELLLIGWEGAGWGVPTVDLAHIDLAPYLSIVAASWPGVRLADLRRLAAVGHVFGRVAAIRAVSSGLAAHATHELRPVLATLGALHSGLEHAVGALREHVAFDSLATGVAA